MNRRRCLEIMIAVGGIGIGAGRTILKMLTPRRFVKARKSTKYPGKIIAFNEKNINKPSKWSG